MRRSKRVIKDLHLLASTVPETNVYMESEDDYVESGSGSDVDNKTDSEKAKPAESGGTSKKRIRGVSSRSGDCGGVGAAELEKSL